MRARTLLVGLVAAAATALAAPIASAAPEDGPVSPMIVGGGNATQTYSFMASMQSTTGSHVCGASLIKADWAVTAAHCVVGRTPGNTQLRVGTTDRTSGGTVVGVSRIIIHPNYRTTGDIALLQLSSAVSQTPIRIAATSGAVGTSTRIIGWGQTCPIRGGCGAPVILQELNTSIVADNQCKGGRIDGPTEICTDNPNDNAGACYGDSGGPQIKAVNGTWELIGATSRAGGRTSTCAVDPSIYSDVPAYRTWITGYTGALS
ncbi:Trypsin [Actinokineospora alba]|uniref:Trypsin n=1 Tax=Actinokineospora alba TaxID=504798 RepID=A0A1H0GB85_9PSEU|nr:serine protease [Actinokineospora alba]TDP69831.1 trypsin [Actinokineospora alba]SDI07726.1 Trypsin [Actinokineospora alba]SDO04091.1 Trypsin [Actinokineospora alba]